MANKILSLGRNRFGLFLIVVLLVLGLFFRFVNLDKKVYWFDEAFTSLRVSGYLEADVVQHVSKAGVIPTENLQKYQQFNLEKSLTDTIKSLAVEDPQHPPLYYVIARFWAQWFGSSVAVMRSLPAIISLLAFPCVYWLCLELFKSPLVGWIAIVLITVSPFHVLYAQEARQYSLWPVTILLSSAALLRALRLKTKASWGIYAVTLTVSLYTFLLSIPVAIGHGIYVLAMEKFRLSKTLFSYIIASFLGTLFFLPWLLVVINNLSQAQHVTAFTAYRTRFLLLNWKARTLDLSRLFIDLNFKPITLVILIVLVLVGYALYFLCRTTTKRVWLFIVTLIGSTAIPLLLPDLILGENRAVNPRYLTPSYLGIELAVAYLFATKPTFSSVKIWRHKLWQIAMITLISCGVLSCGINSQAESAWIKIFNTTNPQIARIINQRPQPLLISDADTADLLSLSHLLNPKVKLLLKPKCYTCNLTLQSDVKPYLPEIPDGFSDVFLFHPRPSSEWLNGLNKEQTDKVQLVSTGDEKSLWKVTSSRR